MTYEQRKAWDAYVADLRADGWKVELTAAILAADAELKGLQSIARAAENVLTLFDYPTAYQDIQERLVGELRTALHELE